MLRELSVQNLAVIEDVRVEPLEHEAGIACAVKPSTLTPT